MKKDYTDNNSVNFGVGGKPNTTELPYNSMNHEGGYDNQRSYLNPLRYKSHMHNTVEGGMGVFQSPVIQKRTQGFVDFDLQVKRPEITGHQCHDRRFETFNIFPKNYTNTHNVQQVNFNKQLDRVELKKFKISMRDGCFNMENHLNLYKPKEKGILQFSKTNEQRFQYIKKRTSESANQDDL